MLRSWGDHLLTCVLVTTITPFFFDRGELLPLAESRTAAYRSAEPFPHCVIDNFMATEPLDQVLAEFPEPDDIAWKSYNTSREVKLATRDDTQLGPVTRHLLSQFNSSVFVEFLEALTGIEGLIPDPHFYGGGLHQIRRGGHLKVHADFNWHERLLLDRRINLLLYLNKDWDEAYGGHLEMWDRSMTTMGERVLPVFNRCVIFNTTDFAMHGHPDALACPEDRTRRSLALYYYTNGRPPEELNPTHTTQFKPRPGESWRREGSTDAIKRWLPPAITEFIRKRRA